MSLEVPALGVEPAGDIEHPLREVDQRQGEVGLQVDGVVAAATPQLQDLAHGDRRRTEDARGVGRLLGVLLRRGDQRPPLGQLAVEAVLDGKVCHRSILPHPGAGGEGFQREVDTSVLSPTCFGQPPPDVLTHAHTSLHPACRRNAYNGTRRARGDDPTWIEGLLVENPGAVQTPCPPSGWGVDEIMPVLGRYPAELVDEVPILSVVNPIELTGVLRGGGRREAFSFGAFRQSQLRRPPGPLEMAATASLGHTTLRVP